jgi:hypothetical protein
MVHVTSSWRGIGVRLGVVRKIVFIPQKVVVRGATSAKVATVTV